MMLNEYAIEDLFRLISKESFCEIALQFAERIEPGNDPWIVLIGEYNTLVSNGMIKKPLPSRLANLGLDSEDR